MMNRAFFLALVLVAFSAVSFATSLDYAIRGSLGAHTATLTGNARVGGSITLTSPLVNNSLSVVGTVTFVSGPLVATSNANVLAFTGGNLTVSSGGTVLYHSSFSSGTVSLLGASNFSVSGKLGTGTAFITDVNGDIRGDTVITAEPGTLGLILTGAGLTGLAGLGRRKKRRSDSA